MNHSIILFALACFHAAPSQAAAAKPSLTLRIFADRQQYLPGETIILYAELENRGSKAVEAPRWLDPDYGLVSYRITDPSGVKRVFAPFSRKDLLDETEPLAPGSSVRGEAKLFFGAAGWTFSRAGTYRVTAEYSDVHSEPVELVIREPATAAERRAAALLLESREAGKFMLFEGGDHLTEGLARVREVADRLPETAHAVHAGYALGISLGRSFADFQKNTRRPPDQKASRIYLTRSRARSDSVHELVLAEKFLALHERRPVDVERLNGQVHKTAPHLRAWVVTLLERPMKTE